MVKIFCASWTIGMILVIISSLDPCSLIFNSFPRSVRYTLLIGSFPFLYGGLTLLIATLIEIIVQGDSLLRAKLKIPKIISLIMVLVLLVLSIFFVIYSLDHGYSVIVPIQGFIYVIFALGVIISLPIIAWRLERTDIGDKKRNSLYFRLKLGAVIQAIFFIFICLSLVTSFTYVSPGSYLILECIGQSGIPFFSLSFLFLLFTPEHYDHIFCCFKKTLQQ